MMINPIGRRVLVKPIEVSNTTESGLVLPDSAKNSKNNEFEVVALGSEYDPDMKANRNYDVKVGDHIVSHYHSGTIINVDGVEFRVINESDIIATIN